MVLRTDKKEYKNIFGLNGHGFSLACPVPYGNDLPVAVGNHDLSILSFDEQASNIGPVRGGVQRESLVKL